MKFDVSLLARLCNAFGPSGSESEVRSIIAESIQNYVEEISVDPVGNLIAKVGNGGDLAIFAHMDEVGFMITGINSDGTLRFSQVGGIIPTHLPSKRVLIGENRISGVIASKPFHLSKNDKKEIGYGDLYLQIGTDSEEESRQLVEIGDLAVFDCDFRELNEDSETYSGKALDNRLGCYLMIQLICEKKLKNATFIFTVEEENGLRGATTFLNHNPISIGIALDTTTANDLPKIKGAQRVCKMDGGGVISLIDGATVYDREWILSLINRIKENNIPVQTKMRRAGGNEASAIQRSPLSARAISLSTPCRYIHGPIGIVKKSDVEATYRALVELCEITANKEGLSNA